MVMACILLPHAAPAQEPLTEHTLRADRSPNPPPATLSSVAWLAGHWKGEGLGGVAEETWLPPAGGAMAGVFRLVDADGVRFYEMVTLVEEAGSLVMRLKHFDPALVGWEERAATVTFPLLRVAPDTLWFDGLTLSRVGAGDEMHVWVALERSDEEVSEALFTYRRQPPPDG
ncbi:MAG: DUF6265 family protein [Gemmatimonadota bacterium]|jgi:hypothetical protein